MPAPPPPAQRRFPFAIQALAASFVDLLGGVASEREPPREFRIFGKGVNKSTKGDFLFDDQAAAGVLSAFREHGIDLVIDYDHAAMAAPLVKVEAAGWIKGLDVRDGELWATGVSWTGSGDKHLRAGEYRYLSPTFDWDEKTGRIGKLITVSLLNTPALYGLDALVAAGALTEEANMTELEQARARIAELEKENATLRGGASTLVTLTALAGLGATATGGEVAAAVQGLTQFKGKVLELTGKDSLPAALGVVEGWKSEAADAARLKTEMEQAAQASCKKEIDGLLDQASKDGKIPPAERPSWEKDALYFGGGKASKEGVAWLSAKVATLVPRPGSGGGQRQTGGQGGQDSQGSDGGQHREPGGRAALSATDLQVARILRIPEKDLREWSDKQSTEGGT